MLDRRIDEREELAHHGVVEQRLLGLNEELMNVNPPGTMSGMHVDNR